jgi:YrbI family 3-deoxy-D-manno-octulosonate 8-phosphate phosphatase
MENGQTVVGFIPVRGGSKSIPRKNILPIGGKPLIYWTLEAAESCGAIDRVVVSTDDDEIASVVARFGSDKVKTVQRSPETATDEASTESAMLEFAGRTAFDHLVLIQATSPLLREADLGGGIEEYFRTGADSLVSVSRQKRFLWEHSPDGFAQPLNYDLGRRPRRQEFSGQLVENGAFYICSRGGLRETGSRLHGRIAAYEMAEEAVWELDEPEDYVVLDALLRRRAGPEHPRVPRKVPYPRQLKVFFVDVDGVLTDGGMYYSDEGDELKKFNTRDGKGIELLRAAGIRVGIMTGESTRIVENRARKLQCDYLYPGCADKLSVLNEFLAREGLCYEDIGYIGDDINDLEVLRRVGFSAAPADAMAVVKGAVDYVCEKRGGEGCVREVAELVLESTG